MCTELLRSSVMKTLFTKPVFIFLFIQTKRKHLWWTKRYVYMNCNILLKCIKLCFYFCFRLQEIYGESQMWKSGDFKTPASTERFSFVQWLFCVRLLSLSLPSVILLNHLQGGYGETYSIVTYKCNTGELLSSSWMQYKVLRQVDWPLGGASSAKMLESGIWTGITGQHRYNHENVFILWCE